MLERLGTSAARHPGRVVLAWGAALVLVVVLAATVGGKPKDNFTIPGSEAQTGLELLEGAAPSVGGLKATVVFQASGAQKVTDPANQSAITDAVTRMQALPGVADKGVSNPFDGIPATPPAGGTAGNIPGTSYPITRVVPSEISTDGSITYVNVTYAGSTDSVPADAFTALEAAVQPAEAAGLTVAVGGPLADVQNQIESSISKYADEIGLAFAVIILLISLGTVTGMFVPILLALFSLAVSTSLTTVLERFIEIGSVGPALGTMMGLGVGIDYSLFIVSRYRQNLGEGMMADQAVGRAVSTSGSAVLFAGTTVCIALLGLFLIGVPYIGVVGMTGALYVAVSVIAALTLLPALLGWLGHRIDALRLPWHRPVEEDTAEANARSFSARWAHEVAKRPVVFTIISLAAMLALTFPVQHLRLGMTDDGQAPLGSPQREAYDLLSRGFGPGNNGQLFVVAQLPASPAPAPATGTTGAQPSGSPAPATPANPLASIPPAVITTYEKLVPALLNTPGVQTATPIPLPDPTLAAVALVPTSGPSDDATSDLVRSLRTTVLPQAVQGTAVNPDQIYVTGTTAIIIDFSDQVQSRMLPFIGAVLALTFVLLMMVFRSLFVPFKAVVMNLLSIGASFGALVLIFEDGFLAGPLGIQETVPIVVFVPMIMFAVLFGLSMDYEVFLLSRIREEYLKTGDSKAAVVTGLANTARVITSAALIMIMVFLAGSTNPVIAVKMLGLGMAIAVLVDATVVRMVLVPSTMELMGKANWWLPPWLDKILPRINVE